MVCLLEEEGKERGIGRMKGGGEQEREGGQARKLFTSEEPQRKRVCVGAATMQVKRIS